MAKIMEIIFKETGGKSYNTEKYVWMDRQGELWSIAKIKISNCFLKFEVEKLNQT